MIARRRVLQMAAALPAASLLPSPLTAAAVEGMPVGRTTTVPADGLAGVALSWQGGARAPAVVRVQTATGWGSPIAIVADHGHGPDDPTGRRYAAPVMAPDAAAYRIEPGDATDLRVHPIKARRAPTGAGLAADAAVHEPIPGLVIHDRSEWTDVARRDTYDCAIGSSVFGLGCRADVGLRHGVIHHTVNVNTYGRDDVPSLLYGIQRYHMDTRGWDDIGYNFVIDRFGGIWQARAGDITEPITGGHTLGLNTESVGVAVLGTFSTDPAPDAVIDSLARLLGWKLSLHGVDPHGRTIVRSTGGDFSEPGDMVEVLNISGHRDNQQTSCPGTRLYERIDEVRDGAAELVPVFGHLTPTYTLDDVTVDGWAIDRFTPADPIDVEIVVDGGAPIVIRADAEVEGLADRYPAAGARHGFHHTVPIDLDTTSIVVRVTAGDARRADLMDLTLFATFIDVEPHRFFAPGVRFLRANDLTTGTRPGLFEPMDPITRAQMATFLHRFMDRPPPDGEAPFTDLTPGSFYVDAVNWLHGAGITTGTTPTTYSPGDLVTRGQMAAFLWRLCGRPAAGRSDFTDVPAGAYYAEAVAWMAKLGITKGVSATEFAPDRAITRGEMATFLHRLATTPAAWTTVTPPSVVG